MPFVSTVGVANPSEGNIVRKAVLKFPFGAERWDPGSVCAEWWHGCRYTKYTQAVSVFFFNSLHGVAARTLLKSC